MIPNYFILFTCIISEIPDFVVFSLVVELRVWGIIRSKIAKMRC